MSDEETTRADDDGGFDLQEDGGIKNRRQIFYYVALGVGLMLGGPALLLASVKIDHGLQHRLEWLVMGACLLVIEVVMLVVAHVVYVVVTPREVRRRIASEDKGGGLGGMLMSSLKSFVEK